MKSIEYELVLTRTPFTDKNLTGCPTCLFNGNDPCPTISKINTLVCTVDYYNEKTGEPMIEFPGSSGFMLRNVLTGTMLNVQEAKELVDVCRKGVAGENQ